MEDKNGSKLSRYLWYTGKTLRIVALWPISESNNFIARFVNFFHFFLLASLTLVQTCQMLYNCWINWTDFESAAETMGPMMGIFTSFGKMCIYRHQRVTLARLIVSLENCLKNGPTDVYEILESHMRFVSIACGSLLTVTWLLIVGYLSTPVLQRVRVLPFESWYPFDYKNSWLLFSIPYAHEIILSCSACFIMSAEITFVMSIMHCCARYEVLQKRLETVGEKGEEDEDEGGIGIVRNEIGRKLSSLVKLHCEILRDVADINTAYTYIVMILFFAAVIAICCAGLQLTSGSAAFTSSTLLFLALVIYFAEQLLFYYLPSEILVNKAFAVAISAYSSGWESFDIKHRKTIGLMIMRSYIPPKLTAGNLTSLRLENYTSFLTTTGSYFTSIRAVADG